MLRLKFLALSILLLIATILVGQQETNPENFTKFNIRKSAQGGKNTRQLGKSKFSSLHYIQKKSQIQIVFDKLEDTVKKDIKVKIVATLIKTDNSKIPVEVFGYSKVTKSTTPKKNDSKDLEKLEITYDVNYFEIEGENLVNTEVDVSSLSLDEGDMIKIVVYNVKKDPKIGFSIIFEVDDFGWKSSASGGFSWLKTTGSNNINFKPSPNLGWSFYSKPNKGSSIGRLLLTPSFGPELTVVDYQDQATFGLGVQVSILANTVKFGYGFLANYDEKSRAYFTIGLNFIEGINTIKSIKENKN